MKEILNNYGIIKHQSGIYELIFNTKERWVSYHRYNDNEYLIDEVSVYIEKFLPEGKFVRTEQQNKDQIIFYFIPYNLLQITNHEIIKFERFE